MWTVLLVVKFTGPIDAASEPAQMDYSTRHCSRRCMPTSEMGGIWKSTPDRYIDCKSGGLWETQDTWKHKGDTSRLVLQCFGDFPIDPLRSACWMIFVRPRTAATARTSCTVRRVQR